METKTPETPLAVKQRMGERVAALRELRGFSRATLAKRSGLSVSTVARIERAQTPFRIDTLSAISDALGVSPWFLSTRRLD